MQEGLGIAPQQGVGRNMTAPRPPVLTGAGTVGFALNMSDQGQPQGREKVLTLVKDFIASITPSL